MLKTQVFVYFASVQLYLKVSISYAFCFCHMVLRMEECFFFFFLIKGCFVCHASGKGAL